MGSSLIYLRLSESLEIHLVLEHIPLLALQSSGTKPVRRGLLEGRYPSRAQILQVPLEANLFGLLSDTSLSPTRKQDTQGDGWRVLRSTFSCFYAIHGSWTCRFSQIWFLSDVIYRWSTFRIGTVLETTCTSITFQTSQVPITSVQSLLFTIECISPSLQPQVILSYSTSNVSEMPLQQSVYNARQLPSWKPRIYNTIENT